MSSLENYKVIADGIATLLFPHAEVIIHEVKTQTVVHIANNFSKRKLGDDSALDELPGDIAEVTSLGPYEKLNWNGQNIRSITSVLKNARGEAEFLLCINLNFSVLEQARAALDAFFQVSRLIPQPDALFKDDWQERINTFLHAWLNERQLSLNTLNMKTKRALVEALYTEGAFDGRSGADYVANVLNMGRATVYKYLRALREEA
ncbi:MULTISPECIES: helix-turn-helix transcriptional regulator [Pseudomonas]|uniref:PAS domain-containing protein n=1 Tax=Pseudomonas kurunegalensis TaxID=485880 RepID=A0ACC5UQA1_9PSED|nr:MULTISPECIES: PAS domain-containing protein [Pseudomonas]MBC3421879.1 PAS domain-containing protein [Pseudomonas sp. RW3S2]MBC3456948.1 PAS domain-containing protein [Pseudomonas mosselii]MBV4516616.1 PAS domain-containing protein [Pseudomonas kurunegalensis]